LFNVLKTIFSEYEAISSCYFIPVIFFINKNRVYLMIRYAYKGIANDEAVKRKGTHTQCHFGVLSQNPQNDIVYNEA
jgi:hypothetical protein